MKQGFIFGLSVFVFLALISAAFRYKHIRYWVQVHTLHGRQLEPAPIHYDVWPQNLRTNFPSTDAVSRAMKERHRAKDQFRVGP